MAALKEIAPERPYVAIRFLSRAGSRFVPAVPLKERSQQWLRYRNGWCGGSGFCVMIDYLRLS